MKKKINIVLVIAVLGLWGSLIYKAINQYFFLEEDAFDYATYNPKNDFIISEKDTFALEPINRDPFLDKAFAPNSEAKVSRPAKNNILKHSIAKPIEKKPFPQINYYGYIKSKEKKEELILLKINGKMKRLRIDEVTEGIKVKKVFHDSILVVANGETRSFKKS